MEHGSSPTNYPGHTHTDRRAFAVLLDFPDFLILESTTRVLWNMVRVRPTTLVTPLQIVGRLLFFVSVIIPHVDPIDSSKLQKDRHKTLTSRTVRRAIAASCNTSRQILTTDRHRHRSQDDCAWHMAPITMTNQRDHRGCQDHGTTDCACPRSSRDQQQQSRYRLEPACHPMKTGRITPTHKGVAD